MSGKRKDKFGRVLRPGESQRKDGRYQYRYRDASGKLQYLYAKTLDELREKEKDVQKAADAGLNYAAAKITVSELLIQYMKQKRGIRESTRATYETTQKLIGRHTFSQRAIGMIKISDCKLFMQELADEGNSYNWISGVKGFLSSAFQMAMEDDILLKNPFSFKLSGVIDNNTEERKALTPEQKESFLASVLDDKCRRKWYDEIVILLGTGLRISELYGLTKADVNLENRTIRVNKQLRKDGNGNYHLTPPKTKSGIRTIPIIGHETYEAFQRVLQNRQTPKVEYIIDGHAGFLFLSRNGTPRTGVFLERPMRKMVADYNASHAEQIQVTPHILRHTFCTDMVRAGVDPKALQYVMGHSDISVTMNIYTNYDFCDAQKAFAKLAAEG